MRLPRLLDHENTRFAARWRGFLYSAVLLAACPLLSASSKQTASTVPAFAQAVAITATNVGASFDTVQRTFCEAKALSYEVNYTGLNGADPSNLCQTWITPATLAARTLILEGLKRYASELSNLTASDSRLDAATTALGASLTGLTGTAPFSSISTKAAAALKVDTNVFVTAVNALGSWLIQRKVQKALPGEIAKMDPSIQSISQLLIADIGSVGANSLIPERGSGLRQVLWDQYGTEITAWNGYVSKTYFENGKVKQGVNPEGALAAVRQLVALANQRRAADLVLAQVAVTLEQMAQAHTELVKATTAKRSLTANLNDLLAEAQRLNVYYQSLANGK